MSILPFTGGGGSIKSRPSFRPSGTSNKFTIPSRAALSRISNSYLQGQGLRSAKFNGVKLTTQKIKEKIGKLIGKGYKTSGQIAEQLKKTENVDYEDRNKIISIFSKRLTKDIPGGLSAEVMKKFENVPTKFWPRNDTTHEINIALAKFKAFKDRNIGYANLVRQREIEQHDERGKNHVKDLTSVGGAKIGMDSIDVKNIHEDAMVGANVSKVTKLDDYRNDKIDKNKTTPLTGEHGVNKGNNQNLRLAA